MGWDSWGVWDGYMHTAIFKMDKQQGPAVEYMEFCSMLCGSLDRRGVWGRKDTCICTASLCYSPESITVLLFACIPIQNLTALVAQMVRHLPIMWETWVQSLGWEDLLEKEMATHSSILAWKIPWMEDPGRLQSMGSQRVGHNWATSLHFNTKLKS